MVVLAWQGFVLLHYVDDVFCAGTLTVFSKFSLVLSHLSHFLLSVLETCMWLLFPTKQSCTPLSHTLTSVSSTLKLCLHTSLRVK